ncbi:hypothetical protein IRJ41_001258 [Triplophysa rosa]|uniref:Uncharacterized protein n=1 Tax=Triplophysa rosa TaxID=992332 RepID=A0A9W7WPU3_TRIRA|nr:hypothetical protein IRJ41_001258 [Triplophysa rosa]
MRPPQTKQRNPPNIERDTACDAVTQVRALTTPHAVAFRKSGFQGSPAFRDSYLPAPCRGGMVSCLTSTRSERASSIQSVRAARARLQQLHSRSHVGNYTRLNVDTDLAVRVPGTDGKGHDPCLLNSEVPRCQLYRSTQAERRRTIAARPRDLRQISKSKQSSSLAQDKPR